MRRILLTTMVAVIGALIASQTWADDAEIAKEAHKLLTKQGLAVNLGVKIGTIKTGKNSVSVEYTDAKGEAREAPVLPTRDSEADAQQHEDKARHRNRKLPVDVHDWLMRR